MEHCSLRGLGRLRTDVHLCLNSRSGGSLLLMLLQEQCCSRGPCFASDKVFECAQIVNGARDSKSVINTCYGNDLMKQLLPSLLEQLELCQKSLSAYLEAKRAEFPRFYFVSDPTLLEILSLGSDPPSVVPHFQSGLFDSLASVAFDKADKGRMTDMFSPQGEKVEFEKPVEAKGAPVAEPVIHANRIG